MWQLERALLVNILPDKMSALDRFYPRNYRERRHARSHAPSLFCLGRTAEQLGSRTTSATFALVFLILIPPLASPPESN